MKFSMTGLETGDLLIEVTTRINLTVYPFSWNGNCHIMISLKSFSSNDSDTTVLKSVRDSIFLSHIIFIKDLIKKNNLVIRTQNIHKSTKNKCLEQKSITKTKQLPYT
jgi:hypothetical protein